MPVGIFLKEDAQEQVLIRGSLPVEFSKVETLSLKKDGDIALVDRKGADLLRLVKKEPDWWQINVRGGDGKFLRGGLCFGGLQQGRSERPINLKSIRTGSVEVVGVDE